MIVEVNETEFRKHLDEASRFAAFFHTPFCANCTAARQMLEMALKRIPFDIKVVSANLNLMPSLAEPLQIQSVPLLVFIKDGESAGRFSAFLRGDELYYSLVHFFGENG